MKSPYVSELTPNAEVTGLFLVEFKEVRQKRSGEPYLSLTLSDKTGELDAKMWDNAGAVAGAFERDDFVRVKGLVQVYQNRPQLTIHKLQKIEDREVELSDFLPASKRDPREMFSELRDTIGAMRNPHLKTLLAAFFADDQIASAFRIAPAAKSVHHAYIGGLMEHVLSMAKLARMAAAHYEGIDADLLMAGVILHDIGKIRELTYERSFGYSTDGQLLGHIQIAMAMLAEKIRAVPGFPPKLRTLLEHMILSHHGALEYGSPKVPLFPEAMLLHLLDNLDAKMNTVDSAIERDSRIGGDFTGYVNPLERALLKKAKYLGEEPSPTPAPSTSPFAEALSQAIKE